MVLIDIGETETSANLKLFISCFPSSEHPALLYQLLHLLVALDGIVFDHEVAGPHRGVVEANILQDSITGVPQLQFGLEKRGVCA